MKPISSLIFILLISIIMTGCTSAVDTNVETTAEDTNILNTMKTNETIVESEKAKPQETEKFDRSLYSCLENAFIANNRLLVNVDFDSEASLYYANIKDVNSSNFGSVAGSKIDTSKISKENTHIDFTFNAEYDGQEGNLITPETEDENLILSFVLGDNGKVTQILMNQTPLKYAEYTDTDLAEAEFDKIIEEYSEQYDEEHGILFGDSFDKKSEDEQLHIIGANTETFDFNDALRNRYNIDYLRKYKWIVVPGVIDTMEMTGYDKNGVPSYKGIIRQDVMYKGSYYYVFTYTGSDFTYMKGDSITAYANIVSPSDASVNLYDAQGNFAGTSQAIEIEIKKHKKGTVHEDYQMNSFEKEFYFDKTYTSQTGESIYFLPNKLGDHPIEIISMRKFGDGSIQMTFIFSDIEYTNSGEWGDISKAVEFLYLYPSGKINMSYDTSFYTDEEYYRKDLIAG